MPRHARLAGSYLFYHIFNRGTERKLIFRTQADYLRFLENLAKYKKKFDWIIYSYCLLPNHYHLQIQVRDNPLAKIIHPLQTAYGVYFNKRHHRVGPLLQGRYKSIIVQKGEHFLHLSKYIHLNPVKIGLVNHPLDYPYSSYGDYCQQLKHPYRLIDKRAMERIIGKPTRKNIQDYRQFVEETEGLIYQPEKAIRNIVGSARFISQIETKLR